MHEPVPRQVHEPVPVRFVITPSDVIFGVAVILTAVGVTAMWVTVTIMDRRTRKREEVWRRSLQRKEAKENEAA